MDENIRTYWDGLNRHDGYLIDVDRLRDRLTGGEDVPVVLDIRQTPDFEAGAIEGALSIPWQDVGRAEARGDLARDRDLAVVCYVGQSSGQVTGILRAQGYRAFSVTDGMAAWEARGYPTIPGGKKVNKKR